eukprot:CAMPEP_0182453514 /NCGR_PEP_ID=MMETSP1319-20130603/544_1 /TAXON_ID=172717 /ORGANISM="Bolidomonas pacifica, Strain RCC208" /LENGTH=168 /DNA_ID=CAMNT_0024651451 /DNA_START=259 /DNA_END=761 /DNA_ORIENTATION=+
MRAPYTSNDDPLSVVPSSVPLFTGPPSPALSNPLSFSNNTQPNPNFPLVSLSTLQTYFGSNSNVIWGDLTNADTRLLYHRLLPRALLRIRSRISSVPGPSPSSSDDQLYELAYLSYSLRQTAKLYARYRCNLPGRLFSHLYSGLRHYVSHGTYDVRGMSWEEIWGKYE